MDTTRQGNGYLATEGCRTWCLNSPSHAKPGEARLPLGFISETDREPMNAETSDNSERQA